MIRMAVRSARIRARKAAGAASRATQIKARNDNLDIAWLRDTEAEAEEQLTEPEDIAAAIIGHLKAALEDVETLADELEPDSSDKVHSVTEAAE